MKTLLLSILSLFVGALTGASAQEDGSPLPFPVKLGGHAATHTKGEPFAQVAQPVANNAEILVETKAAMTIINAGKLDAKGEPAREIPPGIYLLQGTDKTTLDKTADGSKLSPGSYLLSIVSGERTATIKVTIK